ncbi:MAG: hypothetical protein RBT55_03665 [Rhodocyclaceae bacterium]|nr:hypothetical protein [Rhodocyclaceae bacterium]
MPNLNEFTRRIRARANTLGDNLTKTVRRVAITADAAVVLGTPVDTGRARSNWIVALGAPASQVIEPYSPGEAGSTEGANTQAALAQGESVITGYVSGQDMEIHITNNLPYIQRLNDGYSAQAPANFVEMAVMEAVAAARRGVL